jgi:hypothetical protein
MVDTPNGVAQAVDDSPFRSSLQRILESYGAASRDQRFGKSTAVWSEFGRAAELIRCSKVAKAFPRVLFKASAGQGNWATVPWIAALDPRETRKTSEGVYVIYLIRADLSGVYLTLNQATSSIMVRYSDGGARELRHRASRLRKRAGSLADLGFTVGDGIDLRSRARTVRGYQASTVAFKLYTRDMIPRDELLFSDLEGALRVYDTIVPSHRICD